MHCIFFFKEESRLTDDHFEKCEESSLVEEHLEKYELELLKVGPGLTC